MFASLCWMGDQFAAQVVQALPQPKRWCWFIKNGIVFKVADVADLEAVAGRLSLLAAGEPAFDFVLSAHADRRSFAGHAYYKLPPEFDDIAS